MSEQTPKVDINTLAMNIRTRTVSESHGHFPQAQAIAAEIQNEVVPASGWSQMGWLVGDEADVNELEEAVNNWIKEIPEVEAELAKRNFGETQRKEFFNTMRTKIRPRSNT